jgi:hypothetical protein
MSKKISITLLVLAVFAGVAYWQHKPALAWYYVRQLSFAYQENREGFARKVASLEETALPSVLDHLRSSDSMECMNMARALFHLSKQWGPADPRTQQMVETIQTRFGEFSLPGQEKTLLCLTSVLQLDGPRPLPAPLMKVVSTIMIDAERKPELRGASLLLAAELVVCVHPGQWTDVCRAMAERGIHDPSPGPRGAALQLLLREPMRTDKDLLAKVVPLLRDKAVTVRRVALLVLASESDLVRDEALLPLLHDDNLELQDLCQSALRKRGLTSDDLKLARMISDPNPAKRVRVLLHFHQMPDLNHAAWLRQLCQDSSSAVRAAAVRAAGDYPQVDLGDRLREMAQNDPCDAVRLNAAYYLRQRMTRTALD